MARTHELDRPSAEMLDADASFWSLYHSAFPSSEREPRHVIIDSVRSGAGSAIRARRDSETVGFATTHHLVEPNATFLVYLAVAPEQREHGLGRALFEEAARNTPLVVWEIDPPEHATTSADRAIRERRQAFFRRLGGETVLSTYVQPPVSGREVPMLLMARGPIADPKALVRAVYFEKYGTANGIATEILDRLLRRSVPA